MFLFVRLVQLDKLRLQTRAKEEEQSLARGGKDPFIVVKNPSASKGGVAETSIKVFVLLFMSFINKALDICEPNNIDCL